jgi:hypothetical protein
MDTHEQHLNEADRHIVEAERRITEQEGRLAELKNSGGDAREALRLLENFKANLKELYIHRQLIVEAIGKKESSGTAAIA